jgi:hypothetical protein
MSRSPSETIKEKADARFQRILAEVRRGEAFAEDAPQSGGEFANCSFLSVDALFSLEETHGATPGASCWSAASAWLAELEDPTCVSPAAQPRDESPEAILGELGLTDTLTYEEIAQLRRLYMWRNHPDRHGESERESATRRVAIANMLLDRAQARLANPPRG